MNEINAIEELKKKATESPKLLRENLERLFKHADRGIANPKAGVMLTIISSTLSADDYEVKLLEATGHRVMFVKIVADMKSGSVAKFLGNAQGIGSGYGGEQRTDLPKKCVIVIHKDVYDVINKDDLLIEYYSRAVQYGDVINDIYIPGIDDHRGKICF